MEEYKIKKIKSLDNVKTVFNFISEFFVHERTKNTEELALHELYESMIDNLVNGYGYQFYITISKVIIGALVASPLPYDKESLLLNVVGVDDRIRNKGLARSMLHELETYAKKKGYKRIRVLYYETSHSFFEKDDYKPLLELAIPESLQIEDVLKINNLKLEFACNKKFNQINFVDYAVDEIDKRIKKYIAENTPLVKSRFILEKTL